MVLIALLGLNVLVLGDTAIEGPNQIALLLGAAVAGILAGRLGYTWEELSAGMAKGVEAGVGAMIILLVIGSLAGTWLLSGIVPAMIYYGLQVLHPAIFLPATTVVCAVVSISSGSSWSTTATVGIALLAIGNVLGLPSPMVAGAIISGAYFGDKLSPLSDTTNLAPAMAGTDLFTHVRYMVYTTAPSFAITLVVFTVLGVYHQGAGEITEIKSVLEAIRGRFYISPLLFVVPAVVIALIIRKMPALPALVIGTLLGGVTAVIAQPTLIRDLAGQDYGYAEAGFRAVMRSMTTDVAIVTGNPTVDELLSSGGMAGMLNTVWLIVCAMVFGGIMETAGMLRRIAEAIVSFAHTTGQLVGATVATCILANITAADQYLAIVVPGRMYRSVYRARGLKPELLSRTLEDSGTVTSVLIPWNTCGAYNAGVLGVSTMAYLPYCVFNLVSPLMTVFFAAFNIGIRRYSPAELEALAEKEALQRA